MNTDAHAYAAVNDPSNVFYFPWLEKQPLGGVVEYSCCENLKKQQQLAKKQDKILDKYLWRNSFSQVFQGFHPDYFYYLYDTFQI